MKTLYQLIKEIEDSWEGDHGPAIKDISRLCGALKMALATIDVAETVGKHGIQGAVCHATKK